MKLPAWITGRTEERSLMPRPTPAGTDPQWADPPRQTEGPWAGPRPGQTSPAEHRAAVDDTQRIAHRQPDPVTDSGVHFLTTRAAEPTAPATPAVGEHCPTCGGAMPTDPELLAASVALLDARLTEVVPEMYRRLFVGAPRLIPLFEDHAPGLIEWHVLALDDGDELPDGVDDKQVGGEDRPDPSSATIVVRYWTINPDAAQVDVVFGAVKALVALFDPADDEKMEQLAAALNRMGRSHLRFDPPAQWAEYGAVIEAVIGTLRDLASDAWTPRLERVWRKALEYTSAKMIEAQATTITTGRGRRRRTV